MVVVGAAMALVNIVTMIIMKMRLSVRTRWLRLLLRLPQFFCTYVAFCVVFVNTVTFVIFVGDRTLNERRGCVWVCVNSLWFAVLLVLLVARNLQPPELMKMQRN